MCSDTVIKELLDSACPSIKYRIRSEILEQSAASNEMMDLQEQILHDPAVQAVLGWQQPDGWLAWDFHGTKSIEAGIRLLCEKGLSRRFPPLARALQSLENHPNRLERGLGRPGRLLDELGFGGSRMIQATVFAYAGVEDNTFVEEQVKEALAGFKAVLEVYSVKDIMEEYQGRLVFKPGVRWPGIYHLRLLAFTRNWRTPENQAMLIEAIQRLVSLSSLPDIYVRSGSRWLASASFCMHAFNPDMESMDAPNWMMWFHRMECLARLGVTRSIPELRRQVEKLETLLEAQQGWFTRHLYHPYFTQWGAYTGLRLEPDWRSPKSRVNDLTFRSILISHYSTSLVP